MAETARLNLIVDASDAVRRIDELERKVSGLGPEAQKASGKMSGAFNRAKGSIFSLQGAVVSLVAALGIKQLFETVSTFEKMSASLKTVTGSAENAAQAMNLIRTFATETPFSVQELTDSFIKLKAFGLDPSADALRSYGNTASAMGKSLNQAIEAVADAATGEFERLKEFGIRASAQGDQVAFTFQGVTTTVGKNAAEIEGYLRGIGDIQFAGAMEEQMNTLSGLTSNLGDAFDNLFVSVGEAGAKDTFKSILRTAIEAVNGTRTVVDEIPRFFTAAFAAVDKLIIDLELSFNVLGEAIAFAWSKAIALMQEKFANFVSGVARVAENLPGFAQLALGLDNYAEGLRTAAAEAGTLEERLIPLIAASERQKQIIDEAAMGAFLTAPTVATGAGAVGIEPATPSIDPKLQDKLTKQLETLRTHYASEKELALMAFNERILALDELDAARVGAEDERLSLRLSAHSEYEDAITQITADEASKRQKLAEVESKNRLSLTTDLFGSLASLTASKSKELFEIGKASSIATALVKGYEAVTSSYAAGAKIGGPPLGAAFAATAALATARQVSQLSSVSLGGGGSISSGGAGGASAPTTATATPPTVQAATAAQATVPPEEARELRVTVDGDGPNTEAMRQFAMNLAETIRDMGGVDNLVLSGG